MGMLLMIKSFLTRVLSRFWEMRNYLYEIILKMPGLFAECGGKKKVIIRLKLSEKF